MWPIEVFNENIVDIITYGSIFFITTACENMYVLECINIKDTKVREFSFHSHK